MAKRKDEDDQLPARRLELDARSPIWEIQFDETPKSYHSFALYRDLGPERSLAKTAAALKVTVGNLSQWSAKNRWVERADAYDLYIEAKQREARETEISRMARTEATLGRTMVGISLQRLLGAKAQDGGADVNALDANQLTAGDVSRLAEVGVKLSRLATGRPTEFIKGGLLISVGEFAQATGDLTEILMRHIPEERKAIAAEEVRAYSTGERRMIGQ